MGNGFTYSKLRTYYNIGNNFFIIVYEISRLKVSLSVIVLNTTKTC